MEFSQVDWSTLFTLERSLVDSFLRGFLLYFALLLILRVLPRRTTGELGAMDLVFILLLTEAASHALGDFQSISEGLVLIGVFVLCNYGVNQLSYHFPGIQRVFEHAPVQIIREGKLLHRNMRKELLSKDELLANLRENNILDLSEVKKAFVESDGQISFIKYDARQVSNKAKNKPRH